MACRQRTFPTVQFPCVYERAPVPVLTPAMLVEPAREDTRLSTDLGYKCTSDNVLHSTGGSCSERLTGFER